MTFRLRGKDGQYTLVSAYMRAVSKESCWQLGNISHAAEKLLFAGNEMLIVLRLEVKPIESQLGNRVLVYSAIDS